MKKVIIKDDYGNDIEINNLEMFKMHLIEYHSINGRGDYSIHTERGGYFTINEEFYKEIMSIK